VALYYLAQQLSRFLACTQGLICLHVGEQHAAQTRLWVKVRFEIDDTSASSWVSSCMT